MPRCHMINTIFNCGPTQLIVLSKSLSNNDILSGKVASYVGYTKMFQNIADLNNARAKWIILIYGAKLNRKSSLKTLHRRANLIRIVEIVYK